MLKTKDLLDEVIIPTLTKTGLCGYSAPYLVLGTFAVESLMGSYVQQVNGPALGIGQMEPFTFDDLVDRRRKYIDKCGYNPNTITADDLIADNNLATLMTRLKYLDATERLPEPNPWQLGAYWKKYYNTELGKGTEEHFRDCYRKFVSPFL